MCGIVGYISCGYTDILARRKFMDQALIVDTIRGDDSSGIFTVPTKPADSIQIYKQLGDGYSLINSKTYKDLLTGKMLTYRAVIGHNRAATNGGISLDAAHPFQEGPITLVHNGTLRATSNLPFTQYEFRGVNDSHTIAFNLAHTETQEEVKAILEHLRGPFALVWHDARNDSINIVRNKDRPFHLALDKDKTTLYLASEAEMLALLDKRINLGLGNILEPKEGLWLKFTPKKKLKPHVTLLELKPQQTLSRHPKQEQILKKLGIKKSSNNHAIHKDEENYYPDPWDEDLNKEYNKEYNEVLTDNITKGPFREELKGKSSADWKRNITSRKPSKEKMALMAPGEETEFDYVIINRKRKQIPSKLQEELMEFNLEPGQRIAFRPIFGREILAKSTKKHYDPIVVVSGLLYPPTSTGLKGPLSAQICSNVSPTMWRSNQRYVWTVRPVAVKYVLDKNKNYIPRIICKVASFMAPDGSYQVLSSPVSHMLKDTNKNNNKEDDKRRESIPLFYGKHNTLVNKDQWYKDTEKGCCMCSAQIPLSEHKDIEWVNNGQDPLCSNCVDNKNKGKL